jgi:hypothetical protein
MVYAVAVLSGGGGLLYAQTFGVDAVWPFDSITI